MRDEMLDAMEDIASRYGYTPDVKASFKEKSPVIISRD